MRYTYIHSKYEERRNVNVLCQLILFRIRRFLRYFAVAGHVANSARNRSHLNASAKCEPRNARATRNEDPCPAHLGFRRIRQTMRRYAERTVFLQWQDNRLGSRRCISFYYSGYCSTLPCPPSPPPLCAFATPFS